MHARLLAPPPALPTGPGGAKRIGADDESCIGVEADDETHIATTTREFNDGSRGLGHLVRKATVVNHRARRRGTARPVRVKEPPHPARPDRGQEGERDQSREEPGRRPEQATGESLLRFDPRGIEHGTPRTAVCRLADALRLDAYRPAHRSADRHRHVRAELAVRDTLVRTRTRYAALLKALVRREGLRLASGGRC